MKPLRLIGLTQNNLQDLSLEIKKNQLIVFTGVSGSGKSSLVFDTIAAEAQRQMNANYSAFVRNRMPKFLKPKAERIENLNPAIVIDQTPLGGNQRSTVGTITETYSLLRLLYSRIGQPHIGSASQFSFNHPQGMCLKCSGLGRVNQINLDKLIDREKSWNQGAVMDTRYAVGNWYWKQYAAADFFDNDQPLKELTTAQWNQLIYGHPDQEPTPVNPKLEGICRNYERIILKRDLSGHSKMYEDKLKELLFEAPCPDCEGQRLNKETLSVKINDCSIADCVAMDMNDLHHFLDELYYPGVKEVIDELKRQVQRLIDIGLDYLQLDRQTPSLSGGEAQRVKLVKYMGSALNGLFYIFDEPSTGMHARDVSRINRLLQDLRDKENTVFVVEHDPDVIAVADEVIDIGPLAGKQGGEIVFRGEYAALLRSDSLTGKEICQSLPINTHPRKWHEKMTIKEANLHNLKNVTVDIPKHVLTVVTGVAGSGKSTLITKVLPEQFPNELSIINQAPIKATNRATPATYLGIYDEIRRTFAKANHVPVGMFSFNSTGACPTCHGKGETTVELVFMDPIVNECEACGGTRFSDEALSYRLKGSTILDVLAMTPKELQDFYCGIGSKKMNDKLQAMIDTGLTYLPIGRTLTTLSGGERQRLKLTKAITQNETVFILDEPTTGLHLSDIKKLNGLFQRMVDKGNTLIIIEHHSEIIKQADWIIDIGPEGGVKGGNVVFSGVPEDLLESGTITGEYLKKSSERIEHVISC
ncbi:ATP-binding cassette domain-containing protein [Enterococcus raffinosus]|uniref:UvrABC system protein A n=1 Tax=Enterococcus raffinosus TaxID=71452 RepID=A0AAW8TCC9_9ENTE|nr:excinuclease ABC subunit UvrA [Enterococcus raffinosus]MDT2523890.1 excinuclease ABC subunit UvrA [Enterococcus raffinosus]MDT2528809.1 excinuclease ABC subunit UvrA [Enterococcus raffinosus]MDT2534721.1 excinuclease ABC subunit UvrA [Enterococcus raffinosus]MDT2545952.1 excinuclease ABC subunit UvrA [Enterococcus raffinosus]MDT2555811.1 excinuclease ABC subunit UvrA [Enterococcus raffinosus]